MQIKNNKVLTNDIKSYFNLSPPPFLFARGRVALFAALKSLGLGSGDDVLLAGYTCLVVPTAAMLLGARPVYLDIDPRTYNIDPVQLDARCTPAVKALIVQHTYGIPCRMDVILAWAASRHIPIIEDCCLAFGSKFQGKLCGAFGTAAFFSGQWNKPFSTGLGGMLIVHDEDLSGKIQSLIDRELLQPSWAHRFRIWAQIHLYERLVTPKTTPWITAVYRGLSKTGLAVGSSTRGEYSGKTPKNYFMAMTPAQAKKGARELERIEANLAHRRALTRFYEENLPSAGFATVELHPDEDPVFVRYPVRVANKEELLAAAFRHGMEIGSWFESPLHPAGTDLEKFHYRPGSCPESEKAAREVINLPTHPRVSPAEAARVVEFLQRHGKVCLNRG